MSTTNQTAGPSSNNFLAIFNAAEAEYRRVTGKRLDTHPFATKLNTCRSPEDISNVLRTQAQAFSKFCEGDEKLMKWLEPTINILFMFSDTLGEVISLVSSLVHLPWLFAHILFSAVLPRENNLYRYRCSARRKSLPKFLVARVCDVALRLCGML